MVTVKASLLTTSQWKVLSENQMHYSNDSLQSDQIYFNIISKTDQNWQIHLISCKKYVYCKVLLTESLLL